MRELIVKDAQRREDKPAVVSGDGRERRIFDSRARVVRAEGDGGDGMPGFEGYAAVFNELSEPLGMFFRFREKIAPGAFDDAIRTSDVRFLLGHDDHPSSVLARSRPGGNNTLALNEDGHGLFSRVDELPDVPNAQHLVSALERGDIDQMSFGFTVEEEQWNDEPDPETDGTDLPIRTVVKVGRLYDVSPVAFPAYPQTSAAVRDHLGALETERRSSGLSVARARLDLLELEGNRF